jgi:DNA modification methylase
MVRTFNWREIAEPPKRKSASTMYHIDAGGKRHAKPCRETELARPSDVWPIPAGNHFGDKSAHEHPAPYPEALVERILKVLTNPGDVCCDPFLGSGTTGAVALRLGRRFVGCDINDDFVRRARRRLERGLGNKDTPGLTNG